MRIDVSLIFHGWEERITKSFFLLKQMNNHSSLEEEKLFRFLENMKNFVSAWSYNFIGK